MKRIYLSLFFLLCSGFVSQAQLMRSYIAIVKTKDGKKKGILHRVNEDAILLEQGDSLILVKAIDIKNIRIRASKAPYQLKSVFKYDPLGEHNYERLPNSQVRVRKDGQKDPDTDEQIRGHLTNAAMNGAVNLVAAPIEAINSSIINISINQDIGTFKNNKEELSYHSIYYQRNYSPKDDLKKIQAIGKAMKEQ